VAEVVEDSEVVEVVAVVVEPDSPTGHHQRNIVVAIIAREWIIKLRIVHSGHREVMSLTMEMVVAIHQLVIIVARLDTTRQTARIHINQGLDHQEVEVVCEAEVVVEAEVVEDMQDLHQVCIQHSQDYLRTPRIRETLKLGG
jgi:hypothetical protein